MYVLMHFYPMLIFQIKMILNSNHILVNKVNIFSLDSLKIKSLYKSQTTDKLPKGS